MISRAKTGGCFPELGPTEAIKSSFFNDAIQIWNKAPKEIKECESKQTAKNEIKIL